LRKRLHELTIYPEAFELFFARGEIFNTQKISESLLRLTETTLLPDHNQIIDVPLIVARTKATESDLVFPVDIDPETVLGISMEGAIRTEPQFTGGFEINAQQPAGILQGRLNVGNGFQVFVIGHFG